MIKLFNTYHFIKLTNKLIPIIAMAFLICFTYGIYEALIVSPIDYQQGEMVRIMYVHVPSAWMSLGIYTFMAICSFINLVFNIRMAFFLTVASSSIGMSFALITLITGSLWGKPIWGTWWVWDARLTSMLILFLFYLSYVILVNSACNILRAEKPAAVIALIGFINVPIVKFSVDIWYSLHQPASVFRFAKPAIHYSMMIPLMLMFISFILYFLLVLFLRTNTIINNIKKLK